MQVGDRVELTGGANKPVWATIVCVIDPPQFTPEFPEAEWSYLKTGIMVRGDDGTLFHYPDGLVEPGIAITWSVWREDDNGNRFLVQVGLKEGEARAQVEEFTRRGHKQRYWSEPDAE